MLSEEELSAAFKENTKQMDVKNNEIDFIYLLSVYCDVYYKHRLV